MIIIDYRCPKCDRPVSGKESVAIRKTFPTRPAKVCPNPECKTPLNFVKVPHQLQDAYFEVKRGKGFSANIR